MNSKNFQAGSAKVNTTPPLGTRINGDFITHYANQIHDELYSKALALQYGEVLMAIVVVDICVMPKEFLDDVKSRITTLTGIPATHLMISSTHTHAAGSVADVHLGSMDPAYTKWLPNRIVQSVILAIANLKPASIGYGKIQVPEHLLCRRYFMQEAYHPINPVTGKIDKLKTNPLGLEKLIRHSESPVDPELSYLAVKGLDGTWISILGNYSLHYVGDWPNGTISADYFGIFANQLSHLLQADANFVGIMSNGTSGDVNIWDFLHSERYPSAYFEKSKLIGQDLALRVFTSMQDIKWELEPTLAAVYEDLAIALRKPSKIERQLAAEILLQAEYENIVVDQEGLTQIYAREQLLLHEFPDEKDCAIQAFKIGDGVIGALSGEFFSETGLYLKEQVKSSFYFTVTMANGNVGYVPPRSEIQKGGYETWRCRYSCLEENAEETIREKLLHLIQKLQP